MLKKILSSSPLVNIIILLGFTIYFLMRQNYEFLVYAATILVLIWFIAKTDKIFSYTSIAKIGFSLWLLLHLLGGSIYIKGTRLYDMILINVLGEPYYIFKYDQAIHLFCYFVMTIFIYSIVLYISRDKASKVVVTLITALASLGLSAINEIIEFSTVAFFASDGVGTYHNNALDLVFNLTGIILAIAIARSRTVQQDKIS